MDYDAQPRFGQLAPNDRDRYKVFITIKDKEQALRCYQDFSMPNKISIPGARHKIYYVRPEEVFVKYGDIEAEKYYKEEEERKMRQEQEYQERLNMKQQQQQKGQRKYQQ